MTPVVLLIYNTSSMKEVPHEPPCAGTKVCSSCHRSLPVLFFSVHHIRLDGLNSRCRECEAEAQRLHRVAREAAKHRWDTDF